MLPRTIFAGASAERALAGDAAPEACVWRGAASGLRCLLRCDLGVPLTLWNSASSSEKQSYQPLLPWLLCS